MTTLEELPHNPPETYHLDVLISGPRLEALTTVTAIRDHIERTAAVLSPEPSVTLALSDITRDFPADDDGRMNDTHAGLHRSPGTRDWRGNMPGHAEMILWKVMERKNGQVTKIEGRLTLPEARVVRDAHERADVKVWIEQEDDLA